MANKEENTDKNIQTKRKRISKAPANDGTNTPVPDSRAIATPSKEEEALFKQAENPLGDPHKI